MPPGERLGVPDGAVVADRAALEETAGRAAAHVVRGLASRGDIGIATLVSSLDTTRRGFPNRDARHSTHHW